MFIPFSTHITFIWHVASVAPEVQSQQRQNGKMLFTNVAFKWTLFSMCVHMISQFNGSLVGFTTFLAFIVPMVRVHFHVIFQTVGSCKFCRANQTGEILLFRMGSIVSYQIAAETKDFRANGT